MEQVDKSDGIVVDLKALYVLLTRAKQFCKIFGDAEFLNGRRKTFVTK